MMGNSTVNDKIIACSIYVLLFRRNLYTENIWCVFIDLDCFVCVYVSCVCVCVCIQSGESTAEGTYLVAVDDGDKKAITVWDWRARRVIARTMVSSWYIDIRHIVHFLLFV